MFTTQWSLRIISLLTYFSLAYSLPLSSSGQQNTTLSVPKGTTHHGDPNLLCHPSTWTDVGTFFLANFIAHAATVQALPGEPRLKNVLVMTYALVFPTFGILRGLTIISGRTRGKGSSLENAKRAGALCEVVRSPDWKPESGDIVRDIGRKRTIPVRDRFQECKSWAKKESPLICKTGKWLSRISPWLEVVWFRAIATIRLFYLYLWKNRHATTKKWDAETEYELGDLFQDTYPTNRAETCTEQHDRPAKDPLALRENLESEDPNPMKSAILLVQHGMLAFLTKVAKLLCSGRWPIDHTGSESPHASLPRLQVERLHYNPYFKPCMKSLSLGDRQVYGTCKLPEGFALAILDREATVLDLDVARPFEAIHRQGDNSPSIDLISSYNFAQSVIAIFQVLYASMTLYRTKGDQLNHYGYAAFGLTVTPYLVMSLVNFTGTVLTHQYPAIYMVRSSIMEEAQRREGARFSGMVGKLADRKLTDGSVDVQFKVDGQHRIFIRDCSNKANSNSTESFDGDFTEVSMDPAEVARGATSRIVPARDTDRLGNIVALGVNSNVLISVGLLISLVPLVVNGSLSGFKAGGSTLAQRVWTMTWSALGIIAGVLPDGGYTGEGDVFIRYILPMIAYSAPAIGGFVVVAQMLNAYGHCVQLYTS